MSNLNYRQTTPTTGPASTSALGMPLTVDQVNQNFFALNADIALRALKSGDTFSGDVLVSGSGNARLSISGDITAYRAGGNTGGIFLNSAGTRYLFNDGANYNLPSQGLIVGGLFHSISAQFDIALPVVSGGTGVATLTGVAYANGTGAYTAATGGQISASLGATYISNANYALLATSIAGGTAGSLLYNSAANTTATLPIGAVNTFVRSTGVVPTYALLVNADIPVTLYGKTYNGINPTSNTIGFSIAGGATTKTLTINNSLTFAGTDGTIFTFPTTNATLARTDAPNTFVGGQTIGTLSTDVHAVNGTLNVAGAVTTTGLSVGSNGIVTNGGLTSNGNVVVNGNALIRATAGLPTTLAAYVEVSKEYSTSTSAMQKFSWINRFAVGGDHNTTEFISGYGVDATWITPATAIGFTRVRPASHYMAFGHSNIDYLAIDGGGIVTAYAGFTSNVGLTTLGTTSVGTLTATAINAGSTSLTTLIVNGIVTVGSGTITPQYTRYWNGAGYTIFGVEGNTSGATIPGSIAYSTLIGAAGTQSVQIAPNNSVMATFSATGLSVTGQLLSNTLQTSGNALVGGNLVVTGNFTVNGTVETINSTVVNIKDANIQLGVVTTPTDITAAGGGITLLGTTNKTITWNNVGSGWEFSESVNLAISRQFLINGNGVLGLTTLGPSVVNSSLTSVGTLTSLAVGGNTTIGGTLNVSGQIISNTLITANLQTQVIGGSGTAWSNAFMRNDGNNVWLMSSSSVASAALAAQAGFNNFRPFNWNLTTGSVGIAMDGASTYTGGALNVAGALVVGQAVTAPKFLAGEGVGATNGYSFALDGGLDTGMFSTSDGQLSLYANAVPILNMTPTLASFVVPLTAQNISATSAQFTDTVLSPFFESPSTIAANYTIAAGRNVMSVGPITINTGVIVTVNGNWVVV